MWPNFFVFLEKEDNKWIWQVFTVTYDIVATMGPYEALFGTFHSDEV